MASNANLSQKKMPVTIITGFLGSGKTTLLNYILENRQNLKVAVLVNDFGNINIDSQLLVSVNEEMMALSNGCICCTINASLVEAVHRVLEGEHRVDYLLIETSGVADPLPLITTFIGSTLRDFTRIDSILTLVDAQNFTSEYREGSAAFNQIAYGDIILLNKIDLVSQETIDQIKAKIGSIKPGARIISTCHSKVSLSFILDVAAFHKETVLLTASSSHNPHLENDDFVSVSFESDRPLILEKFQTFITEKLADNVFRGKGLLWFRGSQLQHIFQLSGKRCEFQTKKWQQTPHNQLVFIGRNLNQSQLQEQLTECLDTQYS